MGNDSDVGCTLERLVGGDQTSHEGSRPQRLEEVTDDQSNANHRGLIETRQRAAPTHVGGELAEGTVPVPPIPKIRDRDRNSEVCDGVVDVGHHKLLGLGQRNRAQQDSVDHGEDCGIRADPHGNHQNGDEAEGGPFGQRPNRPADFAKHIAHRQNSCVLSKGHLEVLGLRI